MKHLQNYKETMQSVAETKLREENAILSNALLHSFNAMIDYRINHNDEMLGAAIDEASRVLRLSESE